MRPVDCQDLVEVVTELLEGVLAGADERAVLAHLAECDGCATWVEQVRATVAALAALPVEPLAAVEVERLVDAMTAARRP